MDAQAVVSEDQLQVPVLESDPAEARRRQAADGVRRRLAHVLRREGRVDQVRKGACELHQPRAHVVLHARAVLRRGVPAACCGGGQRGGWGGTLQSCRAFLPQACSAKGQWPWLVVLHIWPWACAAVPVPCCLAHSRLCAVALTSCCALE